MNCMALCSKVECKFFFCFFGHFLQDFCHPWVSFNVCPNGRVFIPVPCWSQSTLLVVFIHIFARPVEICKQPKLVFGFEAVAQKPTPNAFISRCNVLLVASLDNVFCLSYVIDFFTFAKDTLKGKARLTVQN